jgi:16S rRNA (cytosine967-C5)-methyltransferase
MKISPARVAAFEILQRIETERSFSSVLLPHYEEGLGSKDRGLCHELVLGVLRRQLYLDRLIEHFAGLRKVDTAIRTSLRLGMYQLLFLDKVPAYSAINESVNLVMRAKKTSAKGFVNAILRRVSEGTPTFEYKDDVERISIETSHPRWLIEKWTANFGAVEAGEIAAANNVIPRVSFRFTGSGDHPSGTDFEKSEFVDGCWLAPSIDENLRSLSDVGEIYFQDEASQLVAQTVERDFGRRFLDVCAAPGGKTTQIARGLRGPAVESMIVAGDLYRQRVHLLRATCQRQGVGHVNVVQYDAETALPFADASFDTVLVDSPCSGTGTIRHNPEIRYFITPESPMELSVKQLAILKSASKVVQPGGRLIYSTCSLQIEENEDVCRRFLAEAENFQLEIPRVPERFLNAEGFARTFPHRDAMDGFFIAEFRRRV